MQNLEEQALQWLQSEVCRSGNIMGRTTAVIACFRKCVAEEKAEICDNTGVPLSSIVGKKDQTESAIWQILSVFLRGNQHDDLQKTHKMMRALRFAMSGPGFSMYKSRESSAI